MKKIIESAGDVVGTTVSTAGSILECGTDFVGSALETTATGICDITESVLDLGESIFDGIFSIFG